MITSPERPREEWEPGTRHLGRRVLVYDRLVSTNTLALQLAAQGASEGIAILADVQTAGRGQHGRSWLATPGDAVLLSLLLYPPVALRRPAILTAWAAVSVCEIVREITSVPARIKWPNDVLLHGRKVCGILIEQAAAARPEALVTVAGIGLNVRQSAEALKAAGLLEATSLAQFASSALGTADVARRLIIHLDEEYSRLCEGGLGTLEACWKWHVGLLGRRVAVESAEATYRGRLLDLTFDALELELPGGRLSVRPERVLHLSPD